MTKEKTEKYGLIDPSQRFTREQPCPVCDGYDAMDRGVGERCFGYLSDDPGWVYCTREEFAGDININSNSNAFPHKLLGNCVCGVRHDGSAKTPSVEIVGLGSRKPSERIVAIYNYPDASGTLKFQIVRYDSKRFRCRRPNGAGGWINNMEGVEPVLYRLDRLPDAKIVFVTEGEKDVDGLTDLGYTATCNPFGAGKWRPEYTQVLAGKSVVIFADNDEKGETHARKVAGSLLQAGCSVQIVRFTNMKVPQSVAMSISGHKTVSMFLRYKITSGDEQREALQKVRAHLNSSPEPAREVANLHGSSEKLGQNSDKTPLEAQRGQRPGR